MSLLKAMNFTGSRCLLSESRRRVLIWNPSSKSLTSRRTQPSSSASAAAAATSAISTSGHSSFSTASSSPSSAQSSFSLLSNCNGRTLLPSRLPLRSWRLRDPFELGPPMTRASVISVHNRILHVGAMSTAPRYILTPNCSMATKAAPHGGEGTGNERGESKGSEKEDDAEGDYDEAEYEPEPEEKISPVRLMAFLLIAGLAVAAIGATVMELMPTHMAPQSIMSRAHDAFQADPDTANHFGTPLKVYGRDNNRHREGRRNYVEHVNHVDPVDGSKRTRVRFNLEGPNGHGMAYAEVSNKMTSGEWVYLCVQDMRTGHVITLQDNRALLLSQAQAGSDEEKNAFRKMLGQ